MADDLPKNMASFEQHIRMRARPQAGQWLEDDEQDILRHLLDMEAAPAPDKDAAMSTTCVTSPHVLARPGDGAVGIKLERPWNHGKVSAASDAAPVELAKVLEVKKPHECEICHKRFRAKSELVTHERIHTGHKPFICMYEGCTKRFAHSSNLGAHHKAHQGIKPYVCMYEGCGKRYAHSGSLKEHVWKHYGVKPFKCSHPDCDRTFTQRSNYSRHMKKCHGQDRVPPPSTAAAAATAASLVPREA